MAVSICLVQCVQKADSVPEHKSDVASTDAKEAITLAEIDAASLHLVEEMETAMGGRSAYHALENIRWNFFGARLWWWNKTNGDVRVYAFKDSIHLVMNVETKKGRVAEKGSEIMDASEVAAWMEKGFSWWINDSYWLVMPFKLRDAGVKLTYLGTRNSLDSMTCEVSRMTFDNVGITPDNAYDLYFDPQSHMLVQWDFYKQSADSIPGFQMPWQGYEIFEGVKFSTDRGQRKISSIAVDLSLSEDIFADPNAIPQEE